MADEFRQRCAVCGAINKALVSDFCSVQHTTSSYAAQAKERPQRGLTPGPSTFRRHPRLGGGASAGHRQRRSRRYKITTITIDKCVLCHAWLSAEKRRLIAWLWLRGSRSYDVAVHQRPSLTF
jgi:hypothetical protein